MAGDHRPPRATRNALTADRQASFVVAVARFVEDLRKGGRFRKGLCVKGVKPSPYAR
jgi:hypothetical protein